MYKTNNTFYFISLIFLIIISESVYGDLVFFPSLNIEPYSWGENRCISKDNSFSLSNIEFIFLNSSNSYNTSNMEGIVLVYYPLEEILDIDPSYISIRLFKDCSISLKDVCYINESYLNNCINKNKELKKGIDFEVIPFKQNYSDNTEHLSYAIVILKDQPNSKEAGKEIDYNIIINYETKTLVKRESLWSDQYILNLNKRCASKNIDCNDIEITEKIIINDDGLKLNSYPENAIPEVIIDTINNEDIFKEVFTIEGLKISRIYFTDQNIKYFYSPLIWAIISSVLGFLFGIIYEKCKKTKNTKSN